MREGGVASNEREEILRLREENLRLREEAQAAPSARKGDPHVINVNQVNEGFFSGCAGFVGVVFVLSMIVSQCSGT